MANDEPLDDARQVAMAAAAAAARVVETVVRETRDQAAQHHAALQRREDQHRAQDTLARLGSRYDSAEARTQRDSDRANAGVPADARAVQRTADLMRGTDPARAAAPQPVATAQPAVDGNRTPPRTVQQQAATRVR